MGIIHYGVHQGLEGAANELLREALAGVTSQTAKRDILTPWKEKHRTSREVMVTSGFPDQALRLGIYHRSANRSYPHLNSRSNGAKNSRVPRSDAHSVNGQDFNFDGYFG